MEPAALRDHGRLAPYQDTSLKLFYADVHLLKRSAASLAQLGFRMVTVAKAPANYFEAMRALASELRHVDGLVLVNHPPRRVTDASGRQYDDLGFEDFYSGVASLLEKAGRPPAEHLVKCVPIFSVAQDSDIRTRVLEELFNFGILAAFMLRVPALGASWGDQVSELTDELQVYLTELFLSREHKVAELKEYKSAEELRQRRAEAEDLMAKVAQLKAAKDYDKAIALCRQAIEILPTEPEAYLEGGRLLVKKKRYPPAMQMFRDAEQVSAALPAPNEEIGNLRVAQVRDHVRACKSAGRRPDADMVNRYLKEAVQNYGQALGKANSLRLVRSDKDDDARMEAVGTIAENILSLELEDLVGTGNPLLGELGRLVKESLGSQAKNPEALPARHLINLGLSALYDQDYETAEDHFRKAARDPESFELACGKLNYLGTQLRQRGRLEQAIEVYQGLIDMRPGFLGVVLFNLAVARAYRARELEDQDREAAGKMLWEAAGSLVRAVYVDPTLPREDNFYRNPVVAEVLADLRQCFVKAAERAEVLDNESDPACLEAAERLEDLTRARNDRDTLQFLFSLAQTTRGYFLSFDRYADEAVLSFAKRLHPLLAKHPSPKMQTFGKVLAVLVHKGAEAAAARAAEGHPALDGAMSRLLQADQAGAAEVLGRALASRPELVDSRALAGNRSLLNLCREVSGKLAEVDLGRFRGRPA